MVVLMLEIRKLEQQTRPRSSQPPRHEVTGFVLFCLWVPGSFLAPATMYLNRGLLRTVHRGERATLSSGFARWRWCVPDGTIRNDRDGRVA